MPKKRVYKRSTKKKGGKAKSCWKGHERVPGTKRGAKGSCRKK